MSPTSFSTITPGNFELTPCRVTYNGVDLGATLGNVKVKISEKLSDLKTDQLGDTVVDRRASGFNATIETSLAENQNKNNWYVIFPAHKLATNPVTGAQSFYFDSAVGYSMRQVAAPLILHPLSRANTDLSGDILIYLATANNASEYDFGPDKQIAMKVHWDMYPDFTTSPPRFMLFGDPSIGLINAFAGAATAGTGNVGNGLVSAITPFNGTTKTEIITLQCVTAGTGGGFYVSGSQSGPLGLAKNGTAFNCPEISFLISNGGTAFAVNDSFQIATTGANYN